MHAPVLKIQAVNDSLVRMDVGQGLQLFAKRKLRKKRTCSGCECELPKGSEAFGEVTSSAMNRANRYCTLCCEVS